MGIFKACDIRGVYQEDLFPATALDIGRAIGTKISGGAVIVGGDVRVSTPELKAALISGLWESGCRVVDINTVPTPVFYFGKKFLNIPSGVMVTASHNPAKYNGFKVAFSEWPVSEAEMQDLELVVAKRQFVRKEGGLVEKQNVLPEYLNYIKSSLAELAREGVGSPAKGMEQVISPAASFKVVLDCGNGCYSNIAPEIFRDFGFKVVELFCEPDGRFPNREPNPAVTANLTALCRQVIAEKADLGIAFDGDGDRAVFVAENGEIVANDQAIALLAKYFLQKHPNRKIVFDIKCSGLVSDEVTKAGGIPLMEKSGHAYIKTTLLKEKAIFGGEISGHFFFEKLGGDDGLFAALLVATIVGKSDRNLRAMINDFPKYNITPDLRVPYADDDRETLLNELAGFLARTGGCRLCRLDGVRGEFAEGWGLVRISVTEPLLTFRFESKGNYPVSRIKDRFLQSVPKLKALVDSIWGPDNLR
jgi:Phosphomannomutase